MPGDPGPRCERGVHLGPLGFSQGRGIQRDLRLLGGRRQRNAPRPVQSSASKLALCIPRNSQLEAADRYSTCRHTARFHPRRGATSSHDGTTTRHLATRSKVAESSIASCARTLVKIASVVIEGDFRRSAIPAAVGAPVASLRSHSPRPGAASIRASVKKSENELPKGLRYGITVLLLLQFRWPVLSCPSLAALQPPEGNGSSSIHIWDGRMQCIGIPPPK